MKNNRVRRGLKVADLIDRYIAEVLPHQPLTEKSQRAHLQWWRREIGEVALQAVRPSLLVECRKRLGQGVTCRGTHRRPSTINRYFSTLGRLFTIAVREWEWLDDSPLRRLAKLKEPPGRSRFLSASERRRLLRACQESPNRNLYAAVVLALSTGARHMEIMGLRWSDIDLKRGLIILYRTKNGTPRSIPLQGHALNLVKARWRQRSVPSGLLFPSCRNSDKPASLRVAWCKALAVAGIQDFRWHDLRHSAASYLAMGGATPLEISEVLGHKSLQMVQRYAHLSVSHTTRVVAAMNRQIFGV